jgi:hypothetical protein
MTRKSGIEESHPLLLLLPFFLADDDGGWMTRIRRKGRHNSEAADFGAAGDGAAKRTEANSGLGRRDDVLTTTTTMSHTHARKLGTIGDKMRYHCH